jgi:hypothetical protein
MGIDTNCQYLNPLFQILGQETFQLPELLSAERSPMATVENKDYILSAAKIGKRNCPPIHIFQGKIRRSIPDLDPFQIRGP